MSTDVVIVGAGAAGTTAALEAGRAGLRTLVLEAFDVHGGAAATSGGGSLMVDTPLQRSLGIVDDPIVALRDWTTWGGPEVDAAWAWQYIARSSRDLFEWSANQGVEWEGVVWDEGNSIPRWHYPSGGGQSLMRTLRAAADPLPVDWRYGVRVASLLRRGRKVTGVVLENGRIIEARAVVVATGGFTNNAKMLHDLGLDPGDGSRILCGGALQAVGGGHDLLRAVGASFSPLERVWRYPFGAVDHRDLSGERGIAVRGIEDGEVWVNAQGQRFHDESRRGGATGTPALLAQRPATCWAIFDRAHACRLTLADPYYRRGDTPCRERIEWFLRTSPFVWSGESFGSLAGAIGLPVERFVETMERFGAWLRDGVAVDPDFGRDLTAVHRADEPPYYAVQFFPMARKALGGVNTDLDCRVLDVGGGPIPGLYAAGEVAGMAGGHLNGTAALEGTMIGPSLLAGRIASQAIVSAVRGPRAGRTPATRLTVPSPDGFGGHRV